MSDLVQIPRKIIHIDMDCFYAQVEMRDDPSLRNVPLAIGGRPGRRSVLCTSNYKAREYGVKAAMPSGLAIKLCPHLVFVSPNFHKYKKESEIIRSIFEEYTDKIQPLSLDEAFLDVTNCKKCSGSATLMAREIKAKILKRTGLTASAGVAPNKFLAKVASDWEKPNGLTVIPPDEVLDFVKKLPVKKISGVGPKTAERLSYYGIKNCEDILSLGKDKVFLHFGNFAPTLWSYAHGVDNREVITEWQRKSLTVEETFLEDIEGLENCLSQIPMILDEVVFRLKRWQEKKSPDSRIKKGVVKLKFNNFKSVTVEKTREDDFFDEIWEKGSFNKGHIEYFEELLKEAHSRSNLPVRLIGLGFRFDEGQLETQLNLFNYKDPNIE